MTMTQREAFVQAMLEKGKTREQADAFLAITRSAFARRGWVPGEPDSREKTAANLGRFVGDAHRSEGDE